MSPITGFAPDAVCSGPLRERGAPLGARLCVGWRRWVGDLCPGEVGGWACRGGWAASSWPGAQELLVLTRAVGRTSLAPLGVVAVDASGLTATCVAGGRLRVLRKRFGSAVGCEFYRCMSMSAAAADSEAAPPAGRFWFLKSIWPMVRVAVAGFLPCPDLRARRRMRREAVSLVGLPVWPGMSATSEDVAQLAMLRLLDLQRRVHRLVLLRQREASVVMARSGVETLLLGLYCMRVPGAVARLHAGNVKALGDTLTYLEEAGIAPASVIRECVRVLGEPARTHLTPWEMVQAIDDANGNRAARSVYRRLYLSLSHFSVHAGGGTLLRYVSARGKLRRRPVKAWTRRAPARVIDAAAGTLAADLAQHAGRPDGQLVRYASRHEARTIVPVVVMAFGGAGRSSSLLSGKRLLETARIAREVYAYLWNGLGAADPVAVRVAFVRERFAAIMASDDPEIPPGAFDPLIEHVAGVLARLGGAPESDPVTS